MIHNRSVPVDTILPHLFYENVADAISWLREAFGFVEDLRYGAPDAPQGAQMHLGGAYIMLGSVRPGRAAPAQVGYRTQMITVFVEDVDAHFRIAKAHGAKTIEDMHDTEYGERQYGVEDLGGHHWIFSKHVRDVAPEKWGAVRG